MPIVYRFTLSVLLFSLSHLPIAYAINPSAKTSMAFNLTMLDKDSSPCSDLNAFVNGKWIVNTSIPDDKTGWGNFYTLHHESLLAQRNIIEQLAQKPTKTSIEQQVYDFYQSGMNQAAIDQNGFNPIKPILNQIDTLNTPQKIVGFIQSSFNEARPYLFQFSIGADYKNARIQIAYMNQGGLGLPAPEYYQSAQYQETRQAYTRYIINLLTLVGTPLAQAKQQAAQILDFETRLAKVSITPTELNEPKNQYHLVNIGEANQITPLFDWAQFFKAQGIRAPENFSLSPPRFFSEINKLLLSAPTGQWQAYLRFHTIHQAASFLSQPFEDAKFQFYGHYLHGKKTMEPRWEIVLDRLNQEIGMALGQLYVQHHFSPEAKQKALILIAHLRASLKTHIKQSDWMTNETKKKALEKLAQLLPKVGYPDTWHSFEALTISPNNYTQNILNSKLFNYRYMLKQIGQATNRQEWQMTPQTVNAYYNPTDNTINFPAAILQAPFFDLKADDALNYGGIGAIIGHEMIHGYDDQGRQFDAYGNHTDWWTEEEHQAFTKRTALLIDQFNAYSPLPGWYVDGRLTLGENIADLEGLSIAYEALQSTQEDNPLAHKQLIDGYTQNQRFFLNWALAWRQKTRPERQQTLLRTDPHSPPQFRVNGPVSNLPEFAEAFSCKEGSPMVRPADKRVKIW